MYNLSYSTDNTTWFNLATIAGKDDVELSIPIIHITNLVYYVRIESTQSNLGASSLLVNWVQISHRSPGVEWLAANLKTSPVINVGAGEYITSLAVGDMGRSAADNSPNTDHRPDGLNDVVVGTSKVGQGDSTHTLFVLTQTGGILDSPVAIDTSVLAGKVGSSNMYDIMAVEMGDFNGDYNLDITLIVGYGPGFGGEAAFSTIWIYYSEPQVGSWTFTEKTMNSLSTSEGGINLKTGNINMSIFIPFMGIMGVMTAAVAVQRLEKRRRP
jgi:hypothetical protein